MSTKPINTDDPTTFPDTLTPAQQWARTFHGYTDQSSRNSVLDFYTAVKGDSTFNRDAVALLVLQVFGLKPKEFLWKETKKQRPGFDDAKDIVLDNTKVMAVYNALFRDGSTTEDELLFTAHRLVTGK